MPASPVTPIPPPTPCAFQNPSLDAWSDGARNGVRRRSEPRYATNSPTATKGAVCARRSFQGPLTPITSCSAHKGEPTQWRTCSSCAPRAIRLFMLAPSI
jgi:hypothetical protein